jgi:Hypoxia induced protein conserved region
MSTKAIGAKWTSARQPVNMVRRTMEYLLRSAVPLAVGAVAVVLVAGLLNMARGGSANLSQQLMRWRVGLQFLAVIVVMAAFYVARR